MYYPACPGYESPGAGPAASSSSSGIPAAGVFVEPTVQAALNCVDPASGMPYFSPDCVNENLRREAANNAARAAANRAVFVQNCNRDWTMNADQYRALGMPVPPNDCEYRGYGQVPAGGGTGGSAAYVAGTPQAVLDWREANPGGGVSVPWDAASAQKLAAPAAVSSSAAPAASGSASGAPAPKPAGGAGVAPVPAAAHSRGFLTSVPDDKPTSLSTQLHLFDTAFGEATIPIWSVLVAAAVGAYFVFGGKK
jgi:hypothetical protein